MGEMLVLSPEGIEKRIHPRALEHFRKFQADVQFEVPLEKLTEVDLNAYLEDFEKPKFQDDMNQIKYWLGTCIDIGDADSNDNQAKLLLFKSNTIMPMFSIKLLLKKVYDRKMKSIKEELKKKEEQERQQVAKAKEERERQAAKAEEERKKKEEDERWSAAYKALRIPTADAKRYLTNPEEYQEFIESICGAVDAYLAREESYTLDSRASKYLSYIRKIRNKREGEGWKTAAEYKAREYNNSLNKEIAKLRPQLYPEKQGFKSYFKKKIADRRYTGHTCTDLLPSEEKQALNTAVQRIAREKLEKIVPDDFYDFIDWKYQYAYFLLPWTDYSFEGMPCLNFNFDVFAVLETRIWLKPGKKHFGGYTFTFPQIEHKCEPYASFFTELKEPEFLGYHYLPLIPSDLGYVFWQTIPLVLVVGLMNGEMEPTGTTISQALEARITYRIKGFEDEVTMPESFANYLKGIGGINQMVSVGILSEKVANILLRRIGEAGASQTTPLPPDNESSDYKEKDLISSLTGLGVPLKDVEVLLPLIPKNITLGEAIKLAMQKYSEIIAQQHSMESQ